MSGIELPRELHVSTPAEIAFRMLTEEPVTTAGMKLASTYTILAPYIVAIEVEATAAVVAALRARVANLPDEFVYDGGGDLAERLPGHVERDSVLAILDEGR